MPDIFISPDEKLHTEDRGLPEKKPVTEIQKQEISGHSHSPISSFCFYPDHIDFETREKEEEVILLLRQHIVVNVKWLFFTLILLFVPSIASYFGVFSSLPAGFDFVITLAWYLFIFAYAMENFLSWFFNVYIVTNMRIIDVDFYNLIYKQVSDANLNKIQDVTYNMGGVVRTIFNFGNVLVQTAAEVSEFEFDAVPNPDRVAKIIEDLMTQKKQK